MASRLGLADLRGTNGSLSRSRGPGRDARLPPTRSRATWHDVFSQPIGGGPTTRGFDSYFGTDVPNWPPYCFIENDRTVGIPSELLPAEKLTEQPGQSAGPCTAGLETGRHLADAGRSRVCVHQRNRPRAPSRFCSTCRSLRRTRRWPSTIPGKAERPGECGGRPGVGDRCGGRPSARCAGTERRCANTRWWSSPATTALRRTPVRKNWRPAGIFRAARLRGYKADAWEGGHRVPFLVRWPAVVKPGGV